MLVEGNENVHSFGCVEHEARNDRTIHMTVGKQTHFLQLLPEVVRVAYQLPNATLTYIVAISMTVYWN